MDQWKTLACLLAEVWLQRWQWRLLKASIVALRLATWLKRGIVHAFFAPYLLWLHIELWWLREVVLPIKTAYVNWLDGF